MPDTLIVGGGISGLATAYYLAKGGGAGVILESRSRLGGVIQTEHVEGCTIEAGPDSFLSAKPAALELIRVSLRDQHSPYAHVLDAVCELAGGLSAGERLSLDRLVAQGPPQELVGLEPFAPPEVMPGVEARR